MICERLFGFLAEAVCQRIAPCARSAFGEGPGKAARRCPLGQCCGRWMAGGAGRPSDLGARVTDWAGEMGKGAIQ